MDKSLESWRRFFERAETDICTVIEYAILVALCDSPNELKRRRDEIMQRLYMPAKVDDCSTEPSSHPNSVQSRHGKVLEVEEGGNSYSMEGDGNRASGISDGVAVALNQGIEEEKELLQEVFTIKRILDDTDESDEEVFQSLRKLERMQLTVEILRETGIGKSVRAVRKSRSSPAIRSIAKDLRTQWILVVDEWVAITEAATDAGRDAAQPVHTSNSDYASGLPSPTLDEDIIQPEALRVKADTFERRDQGRDRSSEASASQPLGDIRDTMRESLNKRSLAKAGLGDVRHRDSSSKGSLFKKDGTKNSQLSRPKQQTSSEEELKVIIEASKRKLQEGYKQAADAKRHRSVQVMPIEDIPKDLPKPQPNNTRARFHHQQWRNCNRR